MEEQGSGRKTRVVVLGGGTAGWMTAAAIARLLPGVAQVHLVESAEIGIVGVGEATLPQLRAFIETLGIDEAAFMAATHATFKLGIEFHDFGRIGDRYVHPFATHGAPLAGASFHHWWLRMHEAGRAGPIGDYCLPIAMAGARRFTRPPASPEALHAGYGYAYQFDATRFAPFLRDFAERNGAQRSEGKVAAVERHANGDVAALLLDDGRRIDGELFIDCSGFRSLLLGDTMGAPWEDWSHWLPCDRAVAVPCASPEGPIEPFTRAHAMAAGWRWRIPLQHRVGNGYVYSSAHLADDAAADALLGAIEGQALAEPRLLRFRAGRRARSWIGNVVGIGLASGFLEPLESTSIHLAQMAITNLIELFPLGAIEARDRAEFNRLADLEYDRIRDFLILHYHATTRADSPFWDHVRTMAVPDTLAEKLTLWRRTAQVARYTEGLFLEPSWVAVYLGQGVIPEGRDPRVELQDDTRIAAALAELRADIVARVERMPLHNAALPSPAERAA